MDLSAPAIILLSVTVGALLARPLKPPTTTVLSTLLIPVAGLLVLAAIEWAGSPGFSVVKISGLLATFLAAVQLAAGLRLTTSLPPATETTAEGVSDEASSPSTDA
jgi:hypothetical protein